MEISSAKRERDFYLSRVGKSKGLAAIKARKQQQADAAAAAPTEVATGQPAGGAAAAKPAQQRMRGFGQRKPKADSAGPAATALPSSLLSLIAGKPKK